MRGIEHASDRPRGRHPMEINEFNKGAHWGNGGHDLRFEDRFRVFQREAKGANAEPRMIDHLIGWENETNATVVAMRCRNAPDQQSG